MIHLEEQDFDAELYAPPPGYSAIVTAVDYQEYIAIFDGDSFLERKTKTPIENVRHWKYLV